MIDTNPTIVEAFDVAAAVGLNPQDPSYEKARGVLMAQLLAYIIAGLVEADPGLEEKIEKLKNEFVEQVKHGR